MSRVTSRNSSKSFKPETVRQMIGREIGNYKILKELGRGGMGVVYKANQTSLGRMVAMKVLPRHLTRDTAFIKRFKNEARAIAKLNHPNVVQIFDIGHEGDIYYYTMEFIEGPALDDIIHKERFLHFDRALNIVGQVAKALQYAHSQGIVHRDIKPSNIMIDKSGRVKVTDFGLALQPRVDRLTVQGDIVGTPEYMSPEQATGQQATVRSDIYSLGVVCYEMLTGKVPFEGETPLMVLNKIRAAEPQWPSSLNPEVSPDLEKLTQKMMAKNPRDRYASCQEIIQDIQRIKARHPIARKNARWSARRAMALSGASLALLACVAGGVFAIRTGNHVTKLAVDTFLPIPKEPYSRPAGELAALDLPSARPPSPDVLDEMRQRVALLEEQLAGIRREYANADTPTLSDLVDTMKQKIILLDDLAVNMRKAMYPDILLLEEGEEIRGKIINESLAKISIHTLWGPKTEIPRERVKYAVYATEDEAQFAALLDANLPQITERMTRVKTELTEFEQQVESERILSAGRIPGGEAIPAERTSEMAADDATSPADRSVHIPFREQAWDVIYDCDAEDIHSFSDDIFSVTTGDVVNSAVCTVIASTAEPLQGTPDTIEMLAAIYRETTSNQGRAQLSLEITFTDGSSITYRLFDSRGDRVDTQDYETDHRLIIRRPDLLLVVNENWQEIRMPVRQDAGTFIEDPAISAIRITHTQEGPATGVFESRCRSLVVNMQEMSSNAE